jgi:hypothetical protein
VGGLIEQDFCAALWWAEVSLGAPLVVRARYCDLIAPQRSCRPGHRVLSEFLRFLSVIFGIFAILGVFGGSRGDQLLLAPTGGFRQSSCTALATFPVLIGTGCCEVACCVHFHGICECSLLMIFRRFSVCIYQRICKSLCRSSKKSLAVPSAVLRGQRVHQLMLGRFNAPVRAPLGPLQQDLF